MRVEVEAVFAAPPSTCWHTLTDWERQAEWMRDAASVRVLSAEREGVGVRLAVRTRVLGVPAFTEVLEVIDWRPNERLVVAHRGFVRGDGVWTFEPVGERTRFHWVEMLSLPIPVIGELALLAYRPVMRRLMRRTLRDLAVTLAQAS